VGGRDLRAGLWPGVAGRGEDHPAAGGGAGAVEEHVLGAGEADALGAERHGLGGLLRVVGVGADLQAVACEHHFMSWT